MLMIVNLKEETTCFQIFKNLFPTFVPIHALIFTGFFTHRPIKVHYINLGQIVSSANFKIIGVMSRSYFHYPGPKLGVNIFVCNYRYLPAHQGQNNRLPNQMAVSFILRMHCNGSITQHRFRSGCSQINKFITVFDRIP